MLNYFSDISIWWILPLILLAIGLSYLLYTNKKEASNWTAKQRVLLISLRAVSLSILFLLLLGLVWETIAYRQEKPLFVTIVDESESLSNGTDTSKLGKTITDFRAELKERFGDRFEFMDLAVGESTRPLKDLKFKDKESNLEGAFEYIREGYFNRNIGGIALISDGNFNKGTHPMYSASRIELTPIFTLGVGDTTSKKDLILKSVNTNDVAFINNQFPIEATVELNRIPKGPIIVNLLHEGKKIASERINCTNSLFEQQEVVFAVDAKQKGFQRYTVSVERKSGEVTYDNNQQSCYIEVLETKNLVYLISSAPHPDLAAIRSVLEEDQQTTIETALLSNYEKPKIKPSLVVWYENGNEPSADLMKQFIEQDVPVLMILSPTTPTGVIKSYELGITPPSGNQQEDAQASLSSGFSAFSFTQEFINGLEIYPPLRTKFGAYKLPENATVLLNQRLGNIVKTEPLFAIIQRKDTKIGVVLGEGVWRWKMKEYTQKQSINGFREFVQKITQFLTIKQQNEPLRVSLPKRFLVTENVEIKAEFYNEAMELITTPEIKLQLKDAKNKKTELVFSTVANFYKVNAGQLNPGTYNWVVSTSHNGKSYRKSGIFVVEDISIEKLDNSANFDVLNQLSQQSDASLHPMNQYKKMLDELEKRTDIATIQYADSGYVALIDWKLIFVLLVVLLGTEWFLRRWWGTY